MGMVLAKSLVRAGFHIVVTQSYMSRVRGGHNTYTIRVSPDPIAAPREGVDLLVALNQETLICTPTSLMRALWWWPTQG